MSARIAPGTRRELGVATWAFSRIAGRVTGTQPPAIFTTLGRHRSVFRGWLHFAGKLMPGGLIPRRETELVILRVAHLAGSDYEQAHHTHLGARAGLTEVEMARVRTDDPGWSPRDQLLLDITDEVCATRDLGDESWARLRAQLDERECIELLLIIGHYQMLATTLGILRLTPDPRR